MNELSLINSFIIDEFNDNNLVNTITLVDSDSIDLNKENIYALVNIDFLTSNIQNDVIIATYKITIVQGRDIVPRKTDSKLLAGDNFLHNLNETHSIAQRFINVLTRQNNDANIEIQSSNDLDALKDWRGGLDGVQFDIDLSIPNIGTSC